MDYGLIYPVAMLLILGIPYLAVLALIIAIINWLNRH
uniref:Uncharacterized protein n=1 Tax=Dulem virus 152 TaxID=3145629 RepID=A0AAU8AU21_9VIRU